MKKLDSESGQTLVFVALGMTMLLGMVAFATDIGVVLHQKRLVQIAADSAALAAAGDLNYGATDAAGAALSASSQNGFTATANGVQDTSTGVTVTINTAGSITDPTFNSAGHVQVIVSQATPTPFLNTFMHLFNSASTYSGMTVSAMAIAQNGATGSGNCVDTLSPTGSTNKNAAGADFYLSGAANVTLPNCGIDDDSKAANAFDINGAFNMDVKAINVVGGDSIGGAVNWQAAHPTLDTASFSDPLNYLSQDEPSATGCVADPNYSGANILTLNPGCYNGFTLSGAANVKLNPGVYVINGGNGFDISGAANISGTGVTIYLTNNAGITLAGALNVSLDAPTSGTYNGILFFQNPADNAPLNFTGAANFNSQGIFYLPSSDVNWNGAANGSFYTDFVVNTFSDTGALNFSDYAVANANSPLVKLSIALVE